MDPITLALAGCLLAFVSFVVGVLCGGCWFGPSRTDFTATHRPPPPPRLPLPTRPAPTMPEVKPCGGFDPVTISFNEWRNPRPEHEGERVIWDDGTLHSFPQHPSETVVVLRRRESRPPPVQHHPV